MAESIDTKSKTTYTRIKNLRLNKEKGVIDVLGDIEPSFFLYSYNKLKNFFLKNTLYRSLLAVSVSLIVIIIFIAVKSRAEVAVFYPKTCLGGWENVANAQGKPNLDGNTKIEDFTKENSAVLVGLSEIYCGGFEGELPKDGDPKKLTLTFSWSVDNGTVIHNNAENIVIDENTEKDPQTLEEDTASQEESTKIEEQTTPSDGEPAFSEENITEEKSSDPPQEAIPLENQEIIQPTPEEQTQTFFFDTFFKKVHAQEISHEEAVVIPTVETPQESPVTETQTSETDNTVAEEPTSVEPVPVIVEDPIKDTDAEVQDGSSVETTAENSEPTITEIADSTIELPTVEEKSDIFMDIVYTIDGVTWSSLGTVGYSEWGRVSFNIPITEWSDIEKLQIKLQPLQTIDTTPVVYIDGMTIEVAYGQAEEEKTIEDSASDTRKYQILNITQAEKMTVETIKDLDQGIIVLLTPKDDGAFVVYDTNDPQFSFTKTVSKDTTEEIPLYNFVPGEFTLVFTGRTDQCSGLLLDECRSDGQYIDEFSFMVKASSKTPENFREITSFQE